MLSLLARLWCFINSKHQLFLKNFFGVFAMEIKHSRLELTVLLVQLDFYLTNLDWRLDMEREILFWNYLCYSVAIVAAIFEIVTGQYLLLAIQCLLCFWIFWAKEKSLRDREKELFELLALSDKIEK